MNSESALKFFLIAILFFHISESTFVAIFNRQLLGIRCKIVHRLLGFSLSPRAILFQQSHHLPRHPSLSPHHTALLISKPYVITMSFGLAEYFLELYYIPYASFNSTISKIGLFSIIVGEVIRKTAIITAQSSFTHDIAQRTRQGHILVTTGIYSWFRHPSYLGWMLWAIGTQILLCNPVSTIVFTIVVFRFFNHRIVVEEHYLVKIFGQEYQNYRKKVPSGLPLIP